jgi:hypothetical protein
MRCQYCGKRLPLFRKLKDGEFCSAAHREQFVAQADQMALAALTEQRERTNRAMREPSPRSVVTAPVDQPATRDSSFSNRYLVPTMAARPLGQLAGVPMNPESSLLPLFMPERSSPSRTGSSVALSLFENGSLNPGPEPLGQLLSADQVLLALHEYGAPHGVSVQPALPGRQAELTAKGRLGISGLLATPPLPLEMGTLMIGRSASWVPSFFPGPWPARLNLSTDSIHFREKLEATAMAGTMPLRLPTAHAPAVAAIGSAVPQLAFNCFIWLVRHPWQLLPSRLVFAGLHPLQSAPVAPAPQLAVAGAAARFPALYPILSTMPVRARASLSLAEPAGPTFALNSRMPETAQLPEITARPLTVLNSEARLHRARAAVSGRLGITGQLADLLQPPDLAAPRRIAWRLEPHQLPAIRSLAVRHFTMEPGAVMPALQAMAVGPRSSDQQIRLSAALRPVRYDVAAGSDSVTFHLEPKVIQPRLRTQPDPARQGAVAKRRHGRNHADAAISSIKIPVLRRFWDHAPADIRWVALIIPLVFFLAWYSWTPNGKALNKQAEQADLAVDTSGVQTVLASFKSRISRRAAVELSEDFRAGLGEWQGAREDWAENWSYDQAGFVRPGNLAIFTPTVALRDYNFEFLGQIENRSLTWVYRAKDTRNYYLGKLLITRGGPVPEVALQRSVVKDGKETQRKQISMTMNLRSDTLYRVRVDVNGSDFTTSVLGQVVDTFTDATHPEGGIGFSGGRGETGRIRWVEVSHQYDTLGRLCAMLVPYGVASAAAPVKTVGQ